jgi:hypothetical protein
MKEGAVKGPSTKTFLPLLGFYITGEGFYITGDISQNGKGHSLRDGSQ